MCALRAHDADKELELTSRMARSVRVGCSAHGSASFALGTMLLTMGKALLLTLTSAKPSGMSSAR